MRSALQWTGVGDDGRLEGGQASQVSSGGGGGGGVDGGGRGAVPYAAGRCGMHGIMRLRTVMPVHGSSTDMHWGLAVSTV